MFRRATVLAVLLCLFGFSQSRGAAIGPEFLLRVDLNDRLVFDRAAKLGLEPVFRWGNEFYLVADGLMLDQLGRSRIQYQVVEMNPFADGFYFVDSKTPFTEAAGLAKLGAEPIDLFSGGALWKSDQALTWRARMAGEAPVAITGEKIPLVYSPTMTSAGLIGNDPLIDSIAVRINQDSVVAYDRRLVNFRTRYAYTDSCLAAVNYLRQKFLSFGYTDVKTDTFPIGYGFYAHNVICKKLGAVEPDKLIIIGAHYDSYNTQSDPNLYAPGADDNGSGTAAVLEIARVLADIPTRKTIIFIPFGAEELGLMGSDYYSGIARAQGWDIELMLNMDMIAWNPDATTNVWINTEPGSVAFADVAAQLAVAHTTLVPYINTSAGGGSDHYPFGQRGYHFIYGAEGDFDTPGWHTNADTLNRLNFPYWTDVVRMMGMTTYYVADAPAGVSTVQLWDVGDGQSLQIQWQPVLGTDIEKYRIHHGTSSGNYTSVIEVPSGGPTSLLLNGLTEGQMYYATVTAVDSGGAESIARTEASLAPYYLPRAPGNVIANVEYLRIDLSWDPTVELDFDHYKLYRGTDSTSLAVYVPSLAANSYSDAVVSAHTRYFYRALAYDHDGNVSAYSSLVQGIPASFDQGLLLADLTAATSTNPPESQQWTVYNTIFGDYEHGYYRYDDYNKPVDKSELGQYSAVYWLDDDYEWERWPADHWAKLNWYLSYGNNLAITGWATPNEVKSAGLLYDLCHITSISRVSAFDCLGGVGDNGFPSVVIDTIKAYPPWSGVLNNIYTMVPVDASAEVILRYRSRSGSNPTSPVAVRRDAGTYKMALIGLPLYFIRNQDAIALVTALNNWFGIAHGSPMGDLNGDNVVDVLDVIELIAAAFQGGTPPSGIADADVNGDCLVDVMDVIYLIDHVFIGGPAPGPGCAL